jgi:5-methylcytosine-specific restriction endonuclease McrA
MSIPPSRVTQPPEAVALVERLRLLRHERCEQIHIAAAGSGPKGLRVRRRALSRSDRATIAAKTDGRCHICGGVLDTAWEADHVLAHSGGGWPPLGQLFGRAFALQQLSLELFAGGVSMGLEDWRVGAIGDRAQQTARGADGGAFQCI